MGRRLFVFVLSTVVLPAAAIASPQTPRTPAEAGRTPPRDRPLPATTGTASIKGRVIDAITGAPLSRARVRLGGLPGRDQPTTHTNTEGEFAFAGLPAGRYMAWAEMSGYLSGDHGEHRTIRSGPRAIRLADGQSVEGVRVPLSRGGVLTGRVLDEFGEPVEHVMVHVIRLPKSGRRTRPDRRWGGNSFPTNDIGEFRIARLERGSYLLLARNRSTNSTTDTQYAPTYYPGVDSIDDAQPVVVERGGVTPGLDITMREVSTTWVSGVVIEADGKPAAQGHINVVSFMAGGSESWSGSGTNINRDGTFRFQVPPGSYRLDASVPGAAAQMGWAPRASASVTVGSEPVTGIELLIGTPASASGRFVFEGSSEPPPAGQSRVSFMPRNERSDCRSGEPALIRPDWTFEARNLWGTCQVNAWTGGRWTLKAVMHDGANLTDRAIEFKPGVQLRDLRIVFTDQRTELNFEVTDDRGLATREFVAIAFRVDRELWNAQRGHVRTYTPPLETDTASTGPIGVIGTGPPGPDGRSRAMMPALPPGEYFVVAVDDAAWEDLQDPDYLEGLSKLASRITLGEGEVRTVPLKRVPAPDER